MSEVEQPSESSEGEERRANATLRRQIQDLLALIREFYTTCHMVAVGQLEPSRAKAKARVVEQKLQAMMAEMLKELDGEEDDV
jgi:hypothetical protein